MAREVGGDYFDFLDLGSGRLGLALGDISGKGVSAALLMASLQAFLRSRARQLADEPGASGDPGQRVARRSRRTRASSRRSSMRVYDSAARTLSYVNAGHNPPFLLRAGTTVVSRLRPTGMALGFDAGAPYGDRPGDARARRPAAGLHRRADRGAQRGRGGVRRRQAAGLLVGNRHLGASDLQRLINAELEAFCGRAPQHDDVTIVVARVSDDGDTRETRACHRA